MCKSRVPCLSYKGTSVQLGRSLDISLWMRWGWRCWWWLTSCRTLYYLRKRETPGWGWRVTPAEYIDHPEWNELSLQQNKASIYVHMYIRKCHCLSLWLHCWLICVVVRRKSQIMWDIDNIPSTVRDPSDRDSGGRAVIHQLETDWMHHAVTLSDFLVWLNLLCPDWYGCWPFSSKVAQILHVSMVIISQPFWPVIPR